LIKKKRVDLVINIPTHETKETITDGYIIRRNAIDFSVPLFTNLQIAKLFVETIYRVKLKDLKIKSWNEYS
jgi:carbamoyl-phosphate synthase large subunit